MHLVVVKPFERFLRGDIICDPPSIATVLSSEHARSVVRVSAQTSEKA